MSLGLARALRVTAVGAVLAPAALLAQAPAAPAKPPAPAPQGAAANPLPSAIRIVQTKDGPVYADQKGHLLYFNLTAQGLACRLGCAERWTPLLAEPDATPVGDWKVNTLLTGEKAWARGRAAFYTSTRDKGLRVVDPEAASLKWLPAWVERPAPLIVLPSFAQVQRIGPQEFLLADYRGRTLYRYGNGKQRPPRCEAPCDRDWTPLSAPLLARPMGDWTLVTQPDGTPQWAFRGAPLYTSDQDGAPGNHNGEGEGTWQAVRL